MKMVIRTVALPSSSSCLLDPADPRRGRRLLNCPRSVSMAAARAGSTSKICCKLGPPPVYPKRSAFDRNSIDWIYEDLPCIQKTAKELADYCLTLEGDPCLSCWRARSELLELERELPKEEVESMITVSMEDGIEPMIRNLHMYSASHRRSKESTGSTNASTDEKMKKETSGSAPKALNQEKTKEEPKYVPEWMPISIEELEEEEKARMADSPHTRLLRAMRVYPSWYTPRPDHDWGD